MHILRARFKKEIVCEFLPPSPLANRRTGRGKSRQKSNRVIILAGGMPTVPSKKETIIFLAQKGYWVFFPRYRGTWESGGHFLSISPHRDILDIINQLPRGFADIFSQRKYKVSAKEIYILCSSFGGSAGLLASLDKRVNKVFAFSPVVDWQTPSKAEPLDWLYAFTREAFGNGYRITKSSWNKLKSGKFYNPAYHAEQIDGSKIFIIHAKDDNTVSWQSVKKFAKKTNSRLLLLGRGDHLSTSNIMKPMYWKRFQKFIKS
jgi:alpha-beta hydrolase superfamily lysophospholipase